MPRARRLRMLAVCVLTIASACSSAKSEKPTTKTFESPAYGYTVRYPSNWSVVAADHQLEAGALPSTSAGGTDILGGKASTKVSTMDLPAVIIAAQPLPAGTSVDDWGKTVADIVLRQKGCANPASTTRLIVGGEQALMFGYPDCPEASGLDHSWTAVVHGDRGYHIVWFDKSARGDDDRAVLEDLLGSMTFTT